MREINVQKIETEVARLCIEANHWLDEETKQCIRRRAEEEDWPGARQILQRIEENIAIAEKGVFLYIITSVGINAVVEMIVAALVTGAAGVALKKARMIQG